MKGQLAPIDILRRDRSKLTQAIYFEGMSADTRKELIEKRDKLNDEIAAMEAAAKK